MPHISLTSNTAWNLYNFRGGVIRALLQEGYQVSTLAPPDPFSQRLAALGCNVIDLTIDNKGSNPLRDLETHQAFKRIYRQLRPDVALHYTIKPVIYGTLVAHREKIPIINTITGLGTAFLRKGWLMYIAEQLYRHSLHRSQKVFFQNRDDCEIFLQRHLIQRDKVEILAGSGIDLQRFSSTPYPATAEETRFLLIARLLWDKGVGEYIAAARQIKATHPSARFQLLGPLGVANRTAVPPQEVERWVTEGVIEYLGESDDVRPHIEQAHCIVLPSYREGLPRTLLEAAAMARPIITTNVVGCKEVVDDPESGYLCRVQDAADLANAMQRFLHLSRAQQAEMGHKGRKKVEQQFDEQQVIHRYLKTIRTAQESA